MNNKCGTCRYKCGTCRWFGGVEDKTCHRFPPNNQPTGFNLTYTFPTVSMDKDWCGEWKESNIPEINVRDGLWP